MPPHDFLGRLVALIGGSYVEDFFLAKAMLNFGLLGIK